MMSRLPFDPSKMQGAKKAASTPKPPTDRPLSVGSLASIIDEALVKGLPRSIRVLGEISGFTDRTHCYFDLKDDQAVISCVMFAGASRKLPFKPASGQQVVASGRIAFYPKQGRTQFYVDSMTPAGEGPLELELRRLVAELRELGYFDPSNKKPLPAFPRRIAVITSATSAAFQDVRETLRKRMPSIEIVLVDVRVQGDNAAPQIARALDTLSARKSELGIDAAILTRGGGSLEDLWAFNEREVADAIRRFDLPIVAAIGHETDTTIAELVADERASTPTQAAVRLSPDRASLLEQLDRADRTLARARERFMETERRRLDLSARHTAHGVRSAIADARVRLGRLETRLTRARPEASHARRVARVETATTSLRRAVARRLSATDPAPAHSALARAMAASLDRHQSRLDALERELVVAGPASVLRRGYSVTTLASGKALRSVADVSPGETLTTRVADGAITSTATGGDAPPPRPAPPAAPDAPLPPRRRPRKGARKKGDPNQLGLF